MRCYPGFTVRSSLAASLVFVLFSASACSTRPTPPAPPAVGVAPAAPAAASSPDADVPVSTGPDDAAPAADAVPPGPALPVGVVDLPLPGPLHPAAYVAPDPSIGPPPWPLVVVLHGNFDRPEWECETWAAEGRKRGWVLCPRGIPRTDAPPEADRWFYSNRVALAEELRAAVAELERVHPGLVRDDGAVVIGFSLGAHMAPRLVGSGALPFQPVALVLGEGGYGVTAEVARSVARRGVRAVAYLCGGRTGCPSMARNASRAWRAARITPGVVVMPGVGHGYADDFEPFARETFEALGR
jgi:dienelactone hydrolase